MKKILLLLFYVFVRTMTVSAQSDSLTMDENNKYIFYQIVNQPATPADSLYKRAFTFAKRGYDAAKLKFKNQDKEKATLYASGSVLVTKKSMVEMHPDAGIDFTMVIEVKDNRYRYWFTDFMVVPQQRDRFANFVPVPGKKEPLETASAKLSKKDANGYTSTLLTNLKSIGSNLKDYMKNQMAADKKEVKKTTIKTKEW